MHTLRPKCSGGDHRNKVESECDRCGHRRSPWCHSFRDPSLKAGQMGIKLRKMTVAVLVAGSVAVLVAAPAEANRGNGTTTTTEPAYVPPYGHNAHPEVPDQNPYGNPVENPVV